MRPAVDGSAGAWVAHQPMALKTAVAPSVANATATAHRSASPSGSQSNDVTRPSHNSAPNADTVAATPMTHRTCRDKNIVFPHMLNGTPRREPYAMRRPASTNFRHYAGFARTASRVGLRSLQLRQSRAATGPVVTNGRATWTSGGRHLGSEGAGAFGDQNRLEGTRLRSRSGVSGRRRHAHPSEPGRARGSRTACLDHSHRKRIRETRSQSLGSGRAPGARKPAPTRSPHEQLGRSIGPPASST